MASTVSTRKVTVVPRDLKRDSSFGMTRIRTIKTPKLATYPKVFITKTPKYSFVAVPLDLLTRRLFYRTSLHSYCLPTSPYFVKRQVTESKLPRRFLAWEQALPGALPAGRERKESLQLRFRNLNSTSNYPVALRRLCCQISANQREAETSANVNKHRKSSAKCNDVITNVISANQHLASTFAMQIFKFRRRSCKFSFFFPPPERPGELARRLVVFQFFFATLETEGNWNELT